MATTNPPSSAKRAGESPGGKRMRDDSTPSLASDNQASSFNARPRSPTRPSSLAISLGIAGWPHGDAALEEALKVKVEQERSKQEYYRLESRNKVLETLKVAMSLGIPGPAIPLLFASNEELAAASASALANASQANTNAAAAVAAHHAALQAAALSPSNIGSGIGGTPGGPGAGSGSGPSSSGATALSSHGPFRFGPPGTPSFPIPLQQQRQPEQQQQQQQQPPPSHAMQGQAQPLHSPSTPARTTSFDGSVPPSSGNTNGQQGTTPMQQQLQPAFAQGQPNSNSRFDVLNFERPQSSSDHFRPGHRGTVSALPAFTNESHGTLTNPTTPTQIGRGPVPHSPFYPPQLVPPPQMVAAPPGMNMQVPQAQVSQGSPGFPSQGVTQSMPPTPQGQVPFMSVNSPRPPPIRARGHNATASTSDLQIHQWKPKQASRDNRWKVITNPFGSRSKEKPAASEDTAQPPPSKVQLQRATTDKAHSSNAINAPEQGSQPSLSQQSHQPSSTSSTSVIAAQNSRRRGHARSRSSASALSPQSPSQSQPASAQPMPRHDEGVAVLADIASEQSKIRQENTQTAANLGQADNDKARPRLPSLLHYLETQAKHVASPKSPPAGGSNTSQAADRSQDSPMPSHVDANAPE